MKLLFVQHDMLVWSSARQWSYTTHLAYVDGLRAAGHEVTVILTSCWPWARQAVGDQTFDQVWINDVTHILGQRPDWEAPSPLNEEDFAWLAHLAPVRVGIVMESLHYEPEEYAEVPELRRRLPLMQQAVLPHITHFCVVDEADVHAIENLGAPAIWTPCHVPRRFFRKPRAVNTANAVFIGSTYRRRKPYADHAALRKLLTFKASGEHATPVPALFDHLNGELRRDMLASPFSSSDLMGFVITLHRVRSELFDHYLDSLAGAMATVNLPSFVKTYPGRVVESMAIGQPVVSCRIPNRPQTARLFGEGTHILTFEGNDPERLAEQLSLLRQDARLHSQISSEGMSNALKHHTSEHRTTQILDWIHRGITPLYWD